MMSTGWAIETVYERDDEKRYEVFYRNRPVATFYSMKAATQYAEWRSEQQALAKVLRNVRDRAGTGYQNITAPNPKTTGLREF